MHSPGGRRGYRLHDASFADQTRSQVPPSLLVIENGLEVSPSRLEYFVVSYGDDYPDGLRRPALVGPVEQSTQVTHDVTFIVRMCLRLFECSLEQSEGCP